MLVTIEHLECGEPGFHYCDKLHTDSLLERKERCNGKLKEGK